jgi:hypothetical protein
MPTPGSCVTGQATRDRGDGGASPHAGYGSPASVVSFFPSLPARLPSLFSLRNGEGGVSPSFARSSPPLVRLSPFFPTSSPLFVRVQRSFWDSPSLRRKRRKRGEIRTKLRERRAKRRGTRTKKGEGPSIGRTLAARPDPVVLSPPCPGRLPEILPTPPGVSETRYG